MFDNEKKTKVVQVRVTEKELAIISEAAKKLGLKKSEYIRYVLKKEIE